ncbi:MAG: fatty acid desaturase [Planctomycetales bacterium]|nr:fatty acid desaturase [Planctomycetales bacterium]
MAVETLSPVPEVAPQSSEPEPQPLPQPRRYPDGVSWATVFWIGVLHLGALAAPFTYSTAGLITMLVLYWLTGGIGICLGYHRLFSHRSFTTYKPIRALIAIIGGLAGEGSAVHWTANHRKHHALSDHEGDPHSPREGFLWSHTLWCLGAMNQEHRQAHHARYAPDVSTEPFLRFLDRTYILWHVALAAGLFAAGYAAGGSALGWSLLVWGMFVRMIVVLHCTWFINSVTHVWGYKNFETTDDSKNLWWVALVTFGEGWHNNHHAVPRRANYGRRWWEFDITYATIWTMGKLGLAWNIAGDRQRT